ncbi:MAG: AsmA family protein [Chitinophagaceae bacterium]|nr:AsmA family protein [Chitinophagaceae bacterium]
MNKYIKRIWKGFAIFLGIILLLYFALFIYVSVNKQSIIKQVSAKISSRLSGDVTIKNAQLSFFTHFPQIAVVLEGINIRDSAFIKHGHTFFEAGKLSGSLGLMALIGKKDALNGIRIENATIYLFTDSTGYTNDYLLKGKKDSSKVSGSSKSNLKFITLKNTRLIVDNQQRAKKIDVNFLNAQGDIKSSDSILHVLLSADAFSHQLGFNLDKGSYLIEKTVKGDFDISYNKLHNIFSFQTDDVSIDKHSFKLKGAFYFNDDRHFDLDISTKNIEMPFGRALLTKKISTAISIISLDKPVNVEAAITGPLGGGEPKVNVSWSGKNANVQTPIVNFSNCSFTGSYNNELEKGKPRNDENSRIELHGLTANWEGFDISSKNVYIDNLVIPVINCDVRSKFNLTTLNNVLQSNSIQLKEGNGELNILYKGPLMGTGNVTPFITGSVLLHDGLVVYNRRGIELENCNGAIVFGGHDIFVKNLKSTIRGNVITMNGRAVGVMTLINSEPDKIHLDWDVYSPQIKLEAFTSLLKSANSGSVAVKKGGLGKLAGQVDRMLDKASAHLSLKADKLIFRKFTASAVNASIALFANDWTLNNVSLRHAGGSMVMNGSIKERNSSFYDVGLKTKLFNVDVKELMESFSNFGQTGIEGNNLKGLLSADADVHMDLNREAVKSSNVQGTVNFSLKNGGLINYEPMQKMQGFFKNRDFSHIYFAELKDRLDISSQEIKINRMEIQSTALTLFVEGVYGLKGNTDISIQAPLSNLKKRDETYVPENIGTEQKAGASIYLRGRPGSDGKIKFSTDIFKKLRGKKD